MITAQAARDTTNAVRKQAEDKFHEDASAVIDTAIDAAAQAGADSISVSIATLPAIAEAAGLSQDEAVHRLLECYVNELGYVMHTETSPDANGVPDTFRITW
jgi:hypothetical protein